MANNNKDVFMNLDCCIWLPKLSYQHLQKTTKADKEIKM